MRVLKTFLLFTSYNFVALHHLAAHHCNSNILMLYNYSFLFTKRGKNGFTHFSSASLLVSHLFLLISEMRSRSLLSFNSVMLSCRDALPLSSSFNLPPQCVLILSACWFYGLHLEWDLVLRAGCFSSCASSRSHGGNLEYCVTHILRARVCAPFCKTALASVWSFLYLWHMW